MGAAVDTEGGQRSPSDQELWDVVGKLELPMILIDLNDLTVSALSRAALKYFGCSTGPDPEHASVTGSFGRVSVL
jgi:hypothetical protein